MTDQCSAPTLAVVIYVQGRFECSGQGGIISAWDRMMPSGIILRVPLHAEIILGHKRAEHELLLTIFAIVRL